MSGAKQGSEAFYLDDAGKRQDAGLHDLEPARPKEYRKASAAAARQIGLSEDIIAQLYGKDA
jgi:hypothetical protein